MKEERSVSQRDSGPRRIRDYFVAFVADNLVDQIVDALDMGTPERDFVGKV